MKHTTTLTLALVFVATLLALGLGFSQNIFFYHDDAFITLRYAYNFLHGSGLVWNEGERVEGYTNFLHLMLISLLGFFGLDLVRASQLIGLAAFGGTCLAAYALVDLPDSVEREGVEPLRYLPLVGTATALPLIVWSLGGLEASLFTLFVTVGVGIFANALAASRPQPYVVSGVLLALAALTRPEGMIVAGFSLGFWLLNTLIRRPSYRFGGLWFGAVLLFIVGPFFMWRLWYYQSLLPNTYYVKIDSISLALRLAAGLRYLSSYALEPPFVLVGLLGALFPALQAHKLTRHAAYLLGTLLTYLAYIVYTGGDHMPVYRFMLPVIPIALLLLCWLLAVLLPTRNLRRRALAAFAILSLLQINSDQLNPRKMDQAAFVGQIVGVYIRGHWPTGALIALNTAGSTPYTALDYRYIDMLGLNDRHIAHRAIETIRLPNQLVPGHAKGDGAYVLSRQPDYIILGPAEGTRASSPWFLSDLELADSPAFQQNYQIQQVQIDVQNVANYRAYGSTQSGFLTFTYYRRLR